VVRFLIQHPITNQNNRKLCAGKLVMRNRRFITNRNSTSSYI
jgi:hypothetical protein